MCSVTLALELMNESQLSFRLALDEPKFIELSKQDEKQVVFCRYLDLCIGSIFSRVAINSTWVDDEENKDKVATVLTNLDKSGNILNIELIDSSGDRQFDILASKSVEISAPFTEVSYLNPKDFKQASEIKFVFEGSLAKEKRIESYNNQLHRTP